MNGVGEESELWNFSLRTYGKEGVADACLWLQDRHGLDVSFLLFLIWVGDGRERLSEQSFDRALAFSSAWARHVVVGLRTLRRALGAGAPVSRASSRNQIGELELAAEKLEQRVLERLARESPQRARKPSTSRAAARDHLRRYLSAMGVEPDQEVERRIAVIVESAAFDER